MKYCRNIQNRNLLALHSWQVVEMAPLHTGAKLSYSSVLEKMGETEAAKSVLDTDDRVLSCVLLYRQCMLHFQQHQIEQFIDKAKLLMLKHIVYPRFVPFFHVKCSKVNWGYEYCSLLLLYGTPSCLYITIKGWTHTWPCFVELL